MFKTLIAGNKAFFKNAADYYRHQSDENECTIFGVLNIVSLLFAAAFCFVSAIRLFGHDEALWMPKALAIYGFIQLFLTLGLQIVYMEVTDKISNLKDPVNAKMAVFVTYTTSLISWSFTLVLAFCTVVDFFALFLYYIPRAFFTHTERKKETDDDKIKNLLDEYNKLKPQNKDRLKSLINDYGRLY